MTPITDDTARRLEQIGLPDDLVELAEVARRLRTTAKELRRRHKAGRFPPMFVDGRKRAFMRLAHLERYMREGWRDPSSGEDSVFTAEFERELAASETAHGAPPLRRPRARRRRVAEASAEDEQP